MGIDLKNNRFPKILCILTFIFIILALTILAKTPPSSGYELSIYNAYPWYFWFFLIGGIFSATLILLKEVFSEKKTNLWILGLLGILIVNSIFLLLPLFRGYPFSGGIDEDIFTHVGWIQEIVQSGHISENNFYPVIHIFTKALSDISGISINKILLFVPVFFSTLYVLFILLLAKAISMNNKQALLITAFSTPLIFSSIHLSISPSFFSLIFLPLLLYMYHKRYYPQRKIELTGLIIILCFFIVFFHPITTLISIIIFLTFIGFSFILRKIKQFLQQFETAISPSKVANIVLILTVTFFAWYTSHAEGLEAIKSIYGSFIYGPDLTIVGDQLSTFGRANLTFFQTIQLVILRYGALLLFSIISLFCLLIIGKRLLFSRKVNELEFSYSMQLIVAFFFAMVIMFSYFIVFNPIRALNYFLIIVPVFIGLVIYSVFEESKKRKNKFLKKSVIIPIVVSLLLFSSVVCIFNVYESPIIWQPNKQTTQMNFVGSTWVIEKRDTTIQTSQDYGFSLWRMEHYINGIQTGDMRMENEPLDIPTHFGYKFNDTLYQVFNYMPIYMITTENGRQAVNAFPENIQPKVHQFTSDDFNKLNSDTTVSKIYENGEFEVWKI